MNNFIRKIKWKLQELKRLPKCTYLCWKYPFLRFWKAKGPFFVYSGYYCIPEGWRKAFGMQMIKEINDSLKRTGGKTTIKAFHIDDIKEKYGSLRFYCCGTSEVYKIINKYEYISKHTCIVCGKPATVQTTGWICPYCDNCIPKGRTYIHFGHKDGPKGYGWQGNMDAVPEEEWNEEEDYLKEL